MTPPGQPHPAFTDAGVSLDDRIEALAGLIAAAPPDLDLPWVAGLLGCAELELYRRDGDEGVFLSAATRLGEAIAVAPAHSDSTHWYTALAVGYADRAEQHGCATDYDRAIEWFSKLHRSLGSHDPQRDRVTVALIDLYWNRYWLLRYGASSDPDIGLVEAERLVAAMEHLAIGGADVAAALYAQMMLGLSHLEQFSHDEHSGALTQGIALLASSLAELPADTPRLALARAELANAFRLRAVLDEDLTSLDLSIAAGDGAIERSSPTDAMVWLMLHQNQALAHEMRWRATGDRADIDRAIACWQILLGGSSSKQVDTWEAAHCGDLLRERGEMDHDPGQVADAIALLTRATWDSLEDPDAWLRWYELGRAHHAYWRLAQDPASLAEAAQCLDHSVELDVPDDDELMRVHIERLTIGYDALLRDCTEEAGVAPVSTPISAVRLRQLIVEGRAALVGAVGADPELRSALALVLSWDRFVGYRRRSWQHTSGSGARPTRGRQPLRVGVRCSGLSAIRRRRP
jgi:tetratricopeptide (TPR) repeat protein